MHSGKCVKSFLDFITLNITLSTYILMKIQGDCCRSGHMVNTQVSVIFQLLKKKTKQALSWSNALVVILFLPHSLNRSMVQDYHTQN